MDDHAGSCRSAPPRPRTPEEREARVLRAMAVAESTIKGIGAGGARSPVQAILRLRSAERVLERNAATHLPSYAQKRAYEECLKGLAHKRAEAALLLPAGEGERLVADEAFARDAIGRLFELAARRREASSFDASALYELPSKALEAPPSPAPLAEIVASVEKLLATTRGLDAEVGEWTFKNLTPLLTGREPAELPPRLRTSSLGSLVGRSSTRRLSALAEFATLGSRFRERLYLLGANTVLLRVISRLAQAEESWRKLLAKDGGAARWERIKQEGGEVLAFLLGPDPALPSDAEGVVARIATASPACSVARLTPFGEIRPDEWEVFGMAYFFELSAILGELSSRDVGITGVAIALLERPTNGKRSRDDVDRVLASVRDTWNSRPPREPGSLHRA